MAKRSRRTPAQTRRATPAPGGTDVTVRYIESSALVAALLEADVAARASIRGSGLRLTSAVTIAEADRAIVRARATGRIGDTAARSASRMLREFERRTDLINVTDAVLARVRRPFPVEPVRTLDAIHLASIEVLASPPDATIVVTRDARVRANAAASGFAVE